jgi:hypothetical protein
LDRIDHLLVMLDREREGREASPSAAVIGGQSSETGGTKGYDGGEKLVDLKRHILVDANGRLLAACVSSADLHPRRRRVDPHEAPTPNPMSIGSCSKTSVERKLPSTVAVRNR